MTRVEVRLLGAVRVLVGGRDAVRHRPEQQALVARLALDAGRPVTAEDLADAAWPRTWTGSGEDPPTRRRLEAEMREVDEALRAADPGRLRLERAPDDAWTLHLAPGVLDLAQFRAARDAGLAAVAGHDVPGAVEHLEAAARLFARRALEDLSGPWASAVRHGLEREALEAYVVLGDLVRRHRPDWAALADALHARFAPQSLTLWEELIRARTATLDRDVLPALLREAGPALGWRLLDPDAAAGISAGFALARDALGARADFAPGDSPAPLELRLFGPFRVLADGVDATPRDPRHAAVLAALVVRRGEAVPWPDLAQAGWPGEGPTGPGGVVGRAVLAAMDLLRGTAGRAEIATTSDGWVLRVPGWWVDAEQVESLLRAATDRLTSGRSQEAVALLADAAARCALPALEGLPGSWFDGPRLLLEALARQVGELYATALVDGVLTVAGTDPQPALRLLEQLVARHPGSAVLRERLMTGHHLAGSPGNALAVHDAALRDLGAEPSGRAGAAMADLREAILRRRTALTGSAVRFGLLDGPVMTVFDRVVTPRVRAQQRALAALLLRRRTVVTVDDLARAVWGEPPLDPATSASRLVAELLDAVREATEPTWGTPKAEEAAARRSPLSVRAVPDGWVADLPPQALDLDEVTALAEQGTAAWHRGDAAGAADALRAVLGRVPAEPFPALDGAWFAAERARLVAWRDGLVPLCVRAELSCGRAADALPDLQRLAAARPAEEDLAAELMAALHAAGRTADALAAYDRCAAALRALLGTPPGPALQMQRRRILARSREDGA